ncbi:MAG TPA: response regulator [Candidatus Saccharimonadales bacterium]|nr:response regulator [Candidatus Saccharimonadales bacterium]
MIAESENELILLFESYLNSLEIKAEIANSDKKVMECFSDSKKKEFPYGTIMLDTHMSNFTGLDVAKRIRSEKPDQKLVLITTTPNEYLPKECLNTAGIADKDILTMPFKLSKLVKVLTN